MKRFGTSVFAAIALLLLAAPFTAQSLDSVLVNNIRNHVKYLASDELQGRGSGTEGNRLAGKYIADFFKNNGIPPLSADSKSLWFRRVMPLNRKPKRSFS